MLFQMSFSNNSTLDISLSSYQKKKKKKSEGLREWNENFAHIWQILTACFGPCFTAKNKAYEMDEKDTMSTSEHHNGVLEL